MNFDFPIEQLVKRSDTRFQLKFAAEARERLAAGDGCALSASRRGLHVLARNEDGLAAPVEALHGMYGASLDVSPPAVRLITGVQVQEPIMHVRISLPTEYQEAVKLVMKLRRASVEEEHARLRNAVLRYEAPLARLLGLPAELMRLTCGTARYWIVLSHYAMVTDDPGGRAA